MFLLLYIALKYFEGKKNTFSMEINHFEAHFANPLTLPSGMAAPPAITLPPNKHVRRVRLNYMRCTAVYLA
jgi:predicted transcriptional regulator